MTALCCEIAYSLLRRIVEREFQILTIMNFMNHWKSNVIFNDLHPLIRLYPLFIGISVVFQCINLYDILGAFSDQAYFWAWKYIGYIVNLCQGVLFCPYHWNFVHLSMILFGLTNPVPYHLKQNIQWWMNSSAFSFSIRVNQNLNWWHA